MEISKHRKVAALPEEVTLFVNCEVIEVIGNRPCYFFENGLIIKQNGMRTFPFVSKAT